MAVLALALFSGCGSDADYANDPRPPSPITVSASISQGKVSVSPASFGAGPVTLIIANLTDDAQTITLETQELSQKSGIKQTSTVINPQGTGQLKVDVPEGTYVVGVDRDGIREATVKVSRERPSSQDQLLQP